MWDSKGRLRRASCFTIFLLHPAKRAELECGKQFAPAPKTFGGRQGFKWNDTLNFFQSRDPQLHFLHRVFLQAPHSVGSRRVSEEIWFEAATQDRPNGFIDLK